MTSVCGFVAGCCAVLCCAGAVLQMCMDLGQANLGVLKMLSDAHANK